MPFNGSGTFSIVNTFVPNTTILSAAVNQNFSDIATGLSDCLTRDGQAGMSAAFKATSGSLAAPSISFTSDATSGLYLSATGIPGFVAHSLGMLLNTTIFSATSATVQAGGSGYGVGDTITETGGTSITQPVFTVATLTGTAVATVTVAYPGFYSVVPSNPVAQGSTSGLGTGCTLNITYNNPAGADYRALFTDQVSALLWQKFGASSFVSGLMAKANGVDFVTGIGASNVATALGLSAPPPGSSFKNLSIKVGSNVTIAVVADFIVTTDGTKFQTTALSQTVNMSTTGVNSLDTGAIAAATWYAIFAVAKPDGTTGGLASLSATSPTMPAGYTYKARIGWVRTAAGSAQLLGTWQLGRRAQYVVGLAQTTTAMLVANVASATLSSTSVANFVPSTASDIFVTGENTTVSTTNVIAPNGSYAATVSTTNPAPVGGELRQFGGTFMLESTNIFVAGSSGSVNVFCNGWVDNL